MELWSKCYKLRKVIEVLYRFIGAIYDTSVIIFFSRWLIFALLAHQNKPASCTFFFAAKVLKQQNFASSFLSLSHVILEEHIAFKDNATHVHIFNDTSPTGPV